MLFRNAVRRIWKLQGCNRAGRVFLFAWLRKAASRLQLFLLTKIVDEMFEMRIDDSVFQRCLFPE